MYGTRLNHFAAFARDDWRAWDFLWGRIHGAMRLAALLQLDSQQVDELVEQIVRAEGHDPAWVRGQIPSVTGLTKDVVWDELRSNKIARRAIDALFALLGSQLQTNPAVPKEALWIAALAGRRSPKQLNLIQRCARIAVTPGRWIAQRKLKL